MDGGTENVSTERLRYEPWSRRKDFWLRKNTSKQVRGEVCLDRADLVIDGMTRRRLLVILAKRIVNCGAARRGSSTFGFYFGIMIWSVRRLPKSDCLNFLETLVSHLFPPLVQPIFSQFFVVPETAAPNYRSEALRRVPGELR